jgi:hypothetical protein
MNPIGRPPLNGIARRRRFTLRLTEYELEQLNVSARQRQIDVSKLVRWALQKTGLIPGGNDAETGR